jgi:hypothetical protein
MATMVDAALRRLTKRPTVARISEIGIWLFAKSPTRARDPRTEITRPRDVTLVPGGSQVGQTLTMSKVLGKTVKLVKRVLRQICAILVGSTSGGPEVLEKSPKNQLFANRWADRA